MNTIENLYIRYVYAFLCIVGFAVFLNILAWILNTRLDNEPVIVDTFVSYNKVTMTKADAESVLAIISAEGFDNAFNHQSTYRDINDMKFHDLRKAYIASSKELLNYLTEASGNVDNIPYYMSFSGQN